MLQSIARPLFDLLSHNEVTEVMINRPGERPFVITTNGHTRDDAFYDENQLESIVKLFAKANNAHAAPDKGVNAILNATFHDDDIQIRIAALLPRYSIGGTSICIRRHSHRVFSLDEIARVEKLRDKAIPDEFEKEWEPAEYLKAVIAARRNILISGSTDSGKTTFSNAVLREIPGDLRILTIEDAQELKPQRDGLNYIQMLAVPADKVTASELLKLALRYRPDSIVVGEVRGGEAYDLVEAWGTGHDGGVSTIHANDAVHALMRLQGLVLDGAPGQLTETSAKIKIFSAVDCVVHLWRSHVTNRRGIGEIISILKRLDGAGDFSFQKIKLRSN